MKILYKKNLYCLVFGFAVLFLSGERLFSYEYIIIKDRSKVEFKAKSNPAVLTVHGINGVPEGRADLIQEGQFVYMSAEVKVDLATFETGFSTRDETMRNEYLETSKNEFRFAILKLGKIKISEEPLEKLTKANNVSFEGDLSLHGKNQKVIGILTLIKEKNLEITLSYKIQLSDFAIKQPYFAGISIANEIEINASATLNKK